MWVNGTLINLGLLPGGCFSLPNSINARGMIVASGDLPVIDPLTGLPEIHADFFYKGQVVDMGTLGGAVSLANMINNLGQATGFAENTNPDPFVSGFTAIFGGFPGATSFHAFIWQNGVMTDLGTLGGPDSAGFPINDRGQIAGLSFTNDIPNPTTGIPTVDPFLWTAGRMIDLGTLGGTIGSANALNNGGQVVGFSDLAGDLTNHAFLWQRGVLTDLGTLGGDNSSATWINEAGEVVGTADLADGTHHAFVWANGRMTDLGTIDGDPCSNGHDINSRGQAIGTSTDCHGHILHAFLWENGSLIDISPLPGSGFVHIEPAVISDTGVITANGLLESGDDHAVILQPQPAGSSPAQAQLSATQNHSAVAGGRWSNSYTARFESTASTPLERVRNQMRYQYRFPGHSIHGAVER
jgi:probable HAF family extracellular repeat protein